MCMSSPTLHTARTMNSLAGAKRRRRVAIGDITPTIVFWGLISATAAIVIYPLVVIGWRSFFPEAGFSFDVFVTAGRLPLGRLVYNTVTLAVSSTLLALFIGGIFAWLNERTDARLGLVGDLVPLTSLFIPHVAAVAGWVALLDPRIGYINLLVRDLLGLSTDTGPLDIYSLPGMIFVSTLFLIPYSYLFISAGLRNLDSSLEEASRLYGAGLWRTLRRVTLPSVLPAVFDAAVLMLITGLTIFSVPLVLGSRAGIDVMSIAIYRFFIDFPPQYDAAIVLSIALLLVVQVLLVIRHQALRRLHRGTIGGKGFRRSVVSLGPFRWIGMLSGAALVLLTGVLPIAGLGIVALQPFWSGSIDWDVMGVGNFAAVFARPINVQGLLNSLVYGVITATILMAVIGLLVAIARYSRAGSIQAVDTLSSLPATIPHIVIAVGFLLAFAGSPFLLHGTLVMLVMAYMVQFMPFAVRSAQAAMADVGDELPDASRIFGAGVFGTLRRVVLPLAMPGMIAGWVIVFSHAITEVTVSSLLSGVRNVTVGRLIIDYLESGSFPQLAAVAIVITVVTAVPVLLLVWFSRRRFMSRLG